MAAEDGSADAGADADADAQAQYVADCQEPHQS